MILKYYRVECDYCKGTIAFRHNIKPDLKGLRKLCKVIIRNNSIRHYHNDCFNKLNLY